MSRTSKLFKDLKVVLEGLENDMFHEGENKMYYNGLEFTKSDWRNLQRGVDQVIKIYDGNNKSSQKFLKTHKEYNRTLRMINYYKNKPNKKERDFIRLEKLQKKMEKYLDRIEDERKFKAKLKIMEQDREKEKRKNEQRERRIEDEFR